MNSFVKKLGYKKEDSKNSIPQEAILESMKKAQESLATQVSQDNSSAGNIDTILNRGSKSFDLGSNDDEKNLEQEFETNFIRNLCLRAKIYTD
ncbi:hypothetical protein N9W34_04690 [Rickettsiales bacterium]|nr:hypothetical protein [Rickettsiales bacterium]